MLERAIDKRAPQARRAGGGEIAGVGGHHHHLPGIEPKQASGGQVHPGRRLVDPGQLRREQAVKAQVPVAREIHEQRGVAIGNRGRDIPAAQQLKPAAHIGPRLKLVPRGHEPTTILLRSREPPPTEQVLERREMQLVKVAPRTLTCVDRRVWESTMTASDHRIAPDSPVGIAVRMLPS